MTALSQTAREIDRSDKRIRADEQCAGENRITERDVVRVLPGVAEFQRHAVVQGSIEQSAQRVGRN